VKNMALLTTLMIAAAGGLVPKAPTPLDDDELGPSDPPRWGHRPSAASARRARVQAIRYRTGWVFARCREMADRSDAEIDALLREEKSL
jgi:hypothetical protein